MANITFTITWLGGVQESLPVNVIDNRTHGNVFSGNLLKDQPQMVSTSADDSGYGDVEIYREGTHSNAALLTQGDNVNI